MSTLKPWTIQASWNIAQSAAQFTTACLRFKAGWWVGEFVGKFCSFIDNELNMSYKVGIKTVGEFQFFNQSGQIIIFHPPEFPCNKGDFPY